MRIARPGSAEIPSPASTSPNDVKDDALRKTSPASRACRLAVVYQQSVAAGGAYANHFVTH